MSASAKAATAGVVVTTVIAVSEMFLTDITVILGLLLGPAVAAVFARPLQTAAVGLYAGALAAAVLTTTAPGWTAEESVRFGFLVLGVVVLTGASVVQTRREVAMREVESVAEAAQLALLRPLPSALDHTALAGRYVSATRKAIVGGDLYEAAYTPHGVRIIIGDARGKGLDGVMMAGVVLGAFRELAYQVPSLSQLARLLDGAVSREAGHEDFVTALLVEVRGQRLSIANCGHPPPLHCSGEGVRRLEPTTSTPLGLGARPSSMSFGMLDWGERLFLYTDGLLEARDSRGRPFDLDAAAHEMLFESDMEEGLDRLLDRVREHTGGALGDDIAVLVLEMIESPQPPTIDEPMD